MRNWIASKVIWFEVQWFSISFGLRFNGFEIQVIRNSIALKFKWFCCQLIWDTRFGCQLIRDSSDLIVIHWFGIQLVWVSNKWLEVQLMWDSNDFKFKWFQIQLLRDSSRLKVIRIEIQLVRKPFNLRFSWCEIQMLWVCEIQVICYPKKSFEAQKRCWSVRLSSKMNFWNSKQKLFCETSFKNEALKLQKRSFSARLPSKMTCGPDTWPQNHNMF